MDEYNTKYQTNIKDVFAPQKTEEKSSNLKSEKLGQGKDLSEIDPNPFADNLMKCLRTGDKKGLGKVLKDIPSEVLFEVLDICNAKFIDSNYISEQIFQNGYSDLFLAKIAESINNMDHLPKMFRAELIYDVLNTENNHCVFFSSYEGEDVDLGLFRHPAVKRFELKIKHAQIAVKATQSDIDKYNYYIKEYRFNRMREADLWFKEQIPQLNKKYNMNIQYNLDE